MIILVRDAVDCKLLRIVLLIVDARIDIVSPVYHTYPSHYTAHVQMRTILIFETGGLLGRFDLFTLVLNLMSGVVLFGAVTAGIDIFARFLTGEQNRARFVKAKELNVHFDIQRDGSGAVDLSSLTLDRTLPPQTTEFQDLEKQMV